jgi:hypothetical protein
MTESSPARRGALSFLQFRQRAESRIQWLAHLESVAEVLKNAGELTPFRGIEAAAGITVEFLNVIQVGHNTEPRSSCSKCISF